MVSAFHRATVIIAVSLCAGIPVLVAGCGSSESSSSSSGASAAKPKPATSTPAPATSGTTATTATQTTSISVPARTATQTTTITAIHTATTPATSTTTTSGPAEPEAQQIRRAFKDQLGKANIAFVTPTKLRVGSTGIVDLRLSFTLSQSALVSQLGGGSGARVTAQISASNTMTAMLTGTEVTIRDITAATQAVGPRSTDWEWEIAPTETGRLQLYLTLDAAISIGGRPANYSVMTFDRTLIVQGVPVPWYSKVRQFLANNWAWMAGIIGLLLGAVGAVKRARQRGLAEGAAKSGRRSNGRPHAPHSDARTPEASQRDQTNQPDGRSRDPTR